MNLLEKYRISAIMFQIKVLSDLLVEAERVEFDLQEAYYNGNYEHVPDLVEKWWNVLSYISDTRREIARLNSSCFVKNRGGEER